MFIPLQNRAWRRWWSAARWTLSRAIFKEGGYLPELPIDPWGRPYLYLSPGENGEIDLYSLGADGLSGGEGQNADIGNWKKQD